MYKSYPRRDFSVPQHLLSGELKTLSFTPPPEDSLFWKLWNNCADLAEKVLKTDYFKGIRQGNLDPNAYGSLMVQDAFYCFKGRDAYSAAATHAIGPDFEKYLQSKVESYDRYNGYYHTTWHVRDSNGVIPGPEIEEYANYEAYVAGNLETPYMFCVMLPCEYLWPWVANQLNPLTPQDSLYRFWVDSNGGEPDGAYQMAKALDIACTMIPVDEEKANEIFRKAMQFEFEVFTAATILKKEYYGK